MVKVFIGSDHAGFALKEYIKEQLQQSSTPYQVTDVGAFSQESVDYPDIAALLCKELKHKQDVSQLEQTKLTSLGILICGSGQGMCIRANREPSIRAALVYNDEVAELARKHNDANVICLGARMMDSAAAWKAIQIFIQTEFEGGRHLQRVKKLSL